MRGSLASVRGLLIDLDGVVYNGQRVIPGADGFLREARARALPFLLVTNNSTASPSDVSKRLAGMGIEASANEILTSAEAAAAYVRRVAGAGARVLPVGERGLREALAAQDLAVVTDGTAEWVVVGLDRELDYAKLARATDALLRGARFVASNRDALLPVEGGAFLPGAGAIVAALEAATGLEAVVIGKPRPALFESGLERLGGLSAADVAMVGDRLDTDIEGAQQAGLRTILVLTGVTGPEQATTSTIQPDAIAKDLPSVAVLLGWTDAAKPAGRPSGGV